MSDIYNGKLLPTGWLVYKTDGGRPYFHNRVTEATQWDPPVTMNSVTNHTSMGTVLRDDGNLNEDDDGYGTTDGEITTTRGNKNRVIHLSSPHEGSARQVSTSSTSVSTGSSKKKKGYTTLPDDSTLSGAMDLEKGDKISPSESSTQGDSGGWCSFINIRSLQSYFDVDTASVLNRILASILPYRVLQEAESSSSSSSSSNSSVVSSIRTSPDFYGPFWIPTSLIFLMFVTSNLAQYISQSEAGTNFLALVVAFSMLYGYLLVIPILLWTITMFLGGAQEREAISMRELISVYGYSFSVALPIALLSLIPSMTIRWILAMIGSTVSFFFVLFNFKRDLIEAEPPFKLSVLGTLVIAQISFYTAFPLYYFNV